MRYVIFADHDGENHVMLSAPLREETLRYFRDRVLPTLRPLSDDQYMNGPAIILRTAACFIYVLDKQDVYWCVEWAPGLIVVRFSPGDTMAWTAIRSPIPNFGGRTPTEDDPVREDEDAENHQYNLVFDAWDAQFEEDVREWRSFTRADEVTAIAYRRAIQHVNTLCKQLAAQYSEGDKRESWHSRCEQNLAEWAGEGIRLV